MNEPDVIGYENAACAALLGMLQAVKALREVGADVRTHLKLASDAVSAWPLPEGYTHALELLLDSHGLVAKIESMIADMHPRVVALVAADAQRDRDLRRLAIN